MKDNRIPYNYHSIGFPYILLPTRSLNQHMYHASVLPHKFIASYTQDIHIIKITYPISDQRYQD